MKVKKINLISARILPLQHSDQEKLLRTRSALITSKVTKFSVAFDLIFNICQYINLIN